MKLRAERTEFADAVTWAQRTVGDRATLPALSGIRLEVSGDRLMLASSNLEIDSELSIPVQGERDGVALAPGKLLADVVRSLPNAAIVAEVNQDVLHLHCGRAQFDLRLMPVEDFPALKLPAAEAVTAVMKAEEFARMVAQVARSASADDARPVLGGVRLEATEDKLTASATDSYRLAKCEIRWDRGAAAEALVPRKALEQARHAAELIGSEVRLVLEPSQATFAFSDRRLTTRLIEGTFPNIEQLIPPSWERRLTIDRAEFMQVVKRVAVVGDSNTAVTPVTLEISSDTVLVKAGSGEIGHGEETLLGALEGEDLVIAFNPRYLTDGLDVAGSERITMQFRDEIKPAVIRTVNNGEEGDVEDPGFLYLLMPVRL
ncbi:MAG: DNA polymerase III subunit beta [Egibacteraceae bacterium]